MYVMHIALQGCLRADRVPYGLTPDTGGHIRYMLELVSECERRPEIRRMCLVTRAFEETALGPEYSRKHVRVSDKVELVRLPSTRTGYLPKEELWRELPSLTEALDELIAGDPDRPDVIHAHYADAGELAARIRARRGIPFVFTAHSLGQVKLRVDPRTEVDEAVGHRLAMEQRAIADAAVVIASSQDEARDQYGGYEGDTPIEVIPPGCQIEDFRLSHADPRLAQVRDELARFLRDPDAPCVLGVARPVRKKNLLGLLESYARDPWLRSNANLVLVAGCRDDLSRCDAESREVLTSLLLAQDRHDLYGRLALPKQHGSEQIPAFYAHAARCGGVFASLALNEPFGLTTVEAASAGLPMVGTRDGGTAEVIETIGHGRVVDPTDHAAVASALREVLEDRQRWSAMAARGREHAGRYRWSSHVDRYLPLLQRIGRPALVDVGASASATATATASATAAASARADPRRRLLFLDLDGTMVGEPEDNEALRRWLRQDGSHRLVLATGRPLHEALAVLERERMPRPEYAITDVGTEIHRLGSSSRTDERWRRWLNSSWQPHVIERWVKRHYALKRQEHCTPRKLSYVCTEVEIVERLRTHLERDELDVCVVYSHGRYLDLLPPRGCKGSAAAYLATALGVSLATARAAGDSGNDESLLRTVGQPIVVGDHHPELRALCEAGGVFVATHCAGRGVVEGIEYYEREHGR